MPSRLHDALAVICIAGLAACGSPPPSEAERLFVTAMEPHHQLGIEMNDIAAVRADDVRLRRMVFGMSGYHHSDTDHLTHWMDQWNFVPESDYPGRIEQVRLDSMRRLSGARFDVAWLEAMIEHHEGALQIARALLESGAREEITVMARTTVDIQSREIAAMGDLLADLGPGRGTSGG